MGSANVKNVGSVNVRNVGSVNVENVGSANVKNVGSVNGENVGSVKCRNDGFGAFVTKKKKKSYEECTSSQNLQKWSVRTYVQGKLISLFLSIITLSQPSSFLHLRFVLSIDSQVLHLDRLEFTLNS